MRLPFTQSEVEILRLVAAEFRQRLGDDDDDPDQEVLSKREHEVLALLASGRNYTQIAAFCTITPNTVRSHVASILRKMGARNAKIAVLMAYRAHIFTPEEIEPIA